MTWRDVRSLELRDFNALVDQMIEDIEREDKEMKRAQRGSGSRGSGAGNGERRTPVMT